MTWMEKLRGAAGGSLIGPGRLALVVGPSGAGKDTLIAHARDAVSGDRHIVFPRRIVTRKASAHEDHDSVSEGAFEQAAADGAFAFWWRAHGLKYALPLSVETDIRGGRTVVCNVSRTVVEELRTRYANVVAVLVTAPPDVLESRLRARGRASDGSLAQRTARSAGMEQQFRADVVIDNVDAPEQGAARLLGAVRTFGFAPCL